MADQHQNQSPTTAFHLQYRALNPDDKEIRLIEVDPLDVQDFSRDPDHQPVVRCRLEHVSLNDGACFYTALSYCWGDPHMTKPIVIDGQAVQVTTNLESALRHLAVERWSDADLGRSLWVDAICIDQRNEAERAQQVALMKDIFRNAHQTFLWLGPATADSGLAMDSLRRMSRSTASIGQHFNTWSRFPFADVSSGSDPLLVSIRGILDATLAELCLDDFARLKALSALFDRPWFRRVWVIQERVLSLHSVVCCGREWIEWEWFRQGFWLLCGVRDNLNIVGSGSGRPDSAALAAFLTTAMNRVIPVSFTRPNSSLLVLFSLLSGMAAKAQLQASDRRDYVFAILSLIDLSRSPLIVADYTKDWAAVRIEVAKACLIYYGPGFLSFAGLGQSVLTEGLSSLGGQNVPSWAPDWSSANLPQPLSIPSMFVVRGQNRQQAYSTLPGLARNLPLAFSADSRLSLDAFHLDDVARLGNLFPEADDFADDTARVTALYLWLQDLEATLLPRANQVYRDAEAVKGALWRTPVADRAFAYNWETERASDETFSAYRALRAGDVGEGVKYANIASVKLLRRRPFLCSAGFLGLGPVGMSVGDSVWAVPGADVPMVFRPGGDGRFSVVGEAYVHGIMDGELLHLLPMMELQKIGLN
ncbi:Ankyrin and HET domain-containing protein [Colletotrichum higginsianum IMI 349063]|uniref:Ankyrin and HET domain-containing protein n=2 Tax=Colletotrichum higginsianum TaxID=80884 RepID=A0A1B7YRL6_COLHI|nr:Ankyrin and HET domain-containing protein [Colletotrichum higginsianum IMI 349063]OBR14671.1 Ankyrin and HET domain-containing protein [Colletotrichum higginsianum IMI 349063]TID01793.1 Heterokaryon incompatibility protein 6, OR allele [Colletotrichum higginsianum]